MERLLCILSLALMPMLALGDVAEEELMERNDAFCLGRHGIYSRSSIPFLSLDSLAGEKLMERNGIMYHVNSDPPYALFNGSAVDYHENGELRSEINYSKGKRNGLSTMYFSDGKVKSKSNYKDGTFHGFVKCFFSNGELKLNEIYKAGKVETLELYGEDGILRVKVDYLQGKRELYYPSGQLVLTNNFGEGDMDYVSQMFHKDGSVYKISEKQKSSTHKTVGIANPKLVFESDGPVEMRYPDGTLELKTTIKNGKYDGRWEYFHQNGNLKIKGNYKNGKKDGMELMYYENGKVLSESNYKGGKKDGLRLGYDSDGRLLTRAYFNNGLRATDTKYLFTNDGLTYEALVLNQKGKPWKKSGQKPFSGYAVQYYKLSHLLSNLQRKGSYLNGLPHGIWEFYTKRGTLEFKDSYDNGELIFSQTYYLGGQLKAKENYKNKQKHGISETFSKTGELEGRTNFKNGNVDGLVELFNVDGQEYQSFCYKNNEAAQMSYCEI